MRPNVDGSSTKCSGKLKFVRLNRLNASTPILSARDPRSGNRFETATSNEAKPGPRTLLRPALPNVKAGGTANALVLNHSAAVALLNSGSPTRFGRSDPAVLPPVFPVL